jgi:hypothetical protein
MEKKMNNRLKFVVFQNIEPEKLKLVQKPSYLIKIQGQVDSKIYSLQRNV